MSPPYLLYLAIHEKSLRGWTLRAAGFLILGVIGWQCWRKFPNPLLQNVIGGLVASGVAIVCTSLWRGYRRYGPIYRFWSDILPESHMRPIAVFLGYRSTGPHTRNMGYGQAMSLPLIAQVLREMNVDWSDEHRVPLSYSDEGPDEHTTALIIGGPLVNKCAAKMHDFLDLPYRFLPLGAGESVRMLDSKGESAGYIASESKNTDCGMVVVWRRTDTTTHVFIIGGKRLGVLAASMLVSDPEYLRVVLNKRGNLRGSYQVVFGASVDFKTDKVRRIDIDSIKVLPIPLNRETATA